MDVGGFITLTVPSAAFVLALREGIPLVVRWLSSRKGPFSSSSSADQLKAVIMQVDKKTDSLYGALAKKNPDTDGYVLLESLGDIRKHIITQTPLQERQASALEKQNVLLERLTGQLSRSPGKYP